MLTLHDKRLIMDSWLCKIFKGSSYKEIMRKKYREMNSKTLNHIFDAWYSCMDDDFRAFVDSQ